MPSSTVELSQTTAPATGTGALASALGALRVTGQLLIGEAYAAPWAVSVPGREELARMVGAGPGVRIVPFHLARRGAFELRVAGRPPQVVDTGEVVLLPAGPAHRLSEGRSPAVTPLAEVLAGRRPRPVARTTTALVCGVFLMHDVRFNPLFSALPPVLRVPMASPSAGYVARGVADLLAAEVGGAGGPRPWVVARLLELLCAEAILAAGAADHGGRAGWLRAVKDPAIGAALDAFHGSPGAAWTVPALARQAALSPSRFAARFRQLLGESPMAYVTTWRLAAAAQRLRDTGERVDEVGRSFGYQSLPAFSRAFKRQWGTAPTAARRATARASG